MSDLWDMGWSSDLHNIKGQDLFMLTNQEEWKKRNQSTKEL